MTEQLKKRSEIEESLKWDLSRLFANEKEYEDTLQKALEEAKSLKRRYAHEPMTAERAEEFLDAYAAIRIKLSHIENYAELALSVDHTDEEALRRESKMRILTGEIRTEIDFSEYLFLEMPDEELANAANRSKYYHKYLMNLLESKKHRLSKASSELLSEFMTILNLPYSGYETTKLADMHFPDFEVGGRKYPLSYVLFENHYQHSPDEKLRRAAFDAFSKRLQDYVHTTANYYAAQVQKEKVMAKLHGFDSVIDYLLSAQRVGTELYNRQIDLIMELLAPIMRRYAKLLQRIHGLEKMTFADLKISLDPEYDPKVSIEESKEYIQGALSVLGKEYMDMVMQSYPNRWVDYAQNIGKSTGGFCSSPYQRESFILLSWTGLLSEVFTLVHELGHAGHFALAQKHNSILEEECSLYFIEAPSTANEMLLSNYLMQKNTDKRFTRWVLSSMIANTYFHNFVTHLLEAAYQREVYRAVDRGETLQASDFSAIKKQVLCDFWGDAVELNEGAELTWMRQPHYYMGLYSYTYSAGLTVATQISQRILHEGEKAAKDWIEVLKAGGSKDAVELAKMAGVDITTDLPLKNTIHFIEDMVSQLEQLTKELEE